MTLRLVEWLLQPKTPWWRQAPLYLPVALVPVLAAPDGSLPLRCLPLALIHALLKERLLRSVPQSSWGRSLLHRWWRLRCSRGIAQPAANGVGPAAVCGRCVRFLWAGFHAIFGVLAFLGTVWAFSSSRAPTSRGAACPSARPSAQRSYRMCWATQSRSPCACWHRVT